MKKINPNKLGGALFASAPILMQLTGNKYAWWMGFGFLIIGPVMLSLKTSEKKTRKSKSKA